jgi:hypothetical protein
MPPNATASQRIEVRVAEYVAADLLRSGAVETGFRDAEEYPEGVEIAAFREDLGAFARRILTERADSAWYLCQQARLFLASIDDMSLVTQPEENQALLQPYVALQRAAMYEPVRGAELKAALPLALVAQQLHPNPRRFGVWLIEGLRRTTDEATQGEVVGTVVLNRPDLVLAALSGRKVPVWGRFVPRGLLEVSRRLRTGRRTVIGGHAIRPLLHLMTAADNPFDQETAC